MQKKITAINIYSAMIFGASMTNLPVQIIEQYAKILKNFDASSSFIISTLEVSFCIGGAASCCIYPILIKKYSIIQTIQFYFAVSLIVSLLSIIPVHWVYLLIIRFITGIAGASLQALAPILASQTLSPEQRGKTIVIYTIVLTLSILLSYVVHLLISFNYNFYFVTYLPVILLAINGMIVTKQVRRINANQQYRADQLVENDIDQNINENDDYLSTQFEQSTIKQDQCQIVQQNQLTKLQYGRLLYIALSLGAMQAFTGIDALDIYCSEIFGETFKIQKSGIYGAIVIGITNTIYILVVAPFAETKSRKVMLMIGAVGCSFMSFINGLIYYMGWPHVYLLGSMATYFLFYNIGPEPIIFMFMSEIFPEHQKVQLNGVSYGLNWVCSILVVFAFDFFQKGKQFIIYWIMSVFILIFGVSGTLLAPETLNKKIEDIEKKIRNWKSFKSKDEKIKHISRVQIHSDNEDLLTNYQKTYSQTQDCTSVQ